jgi:hypothetical protein
MTNTLHVSWENADLWDPRRTLPTCHPCHPCQRAGGAVRRRAARWRRLQPAIIALERYRSETGRYSYSLASLVPLYLPDSQLSAIPATADRPPEYRIDGASYELTFRYFGPGSNWCSYRPNNPGWRCSGLFQFLASSSNERCSRRRLPLIMRAAHALLYESFAAELARSAAIRDCRETRGLP